MTWIPTWDEDAEKSVIGAVLLRADAYDLAELAPEEFFSPAWRTVWEAFGSLRAQEQPIDLVLVAGELERAGKAAAIPLTKLSECVGTVPTADNVAFYAKRIAECALTRRIHVEIREAMESGERGETLLQRVWEAASKCGRKVQDSSVTMAELATQTFRELGAGLERVAAGEPVVRGVPTGLASLDFALGGGLPFGVVSILGGRPSTGKSALARTIADNASAAGMGVHIFSLEDEREPYAHRCLADRARVDLHRLRALDLKQPDVTRIVEAVGDLQRTNWLLDDQTPLSSAQIAMRVRRHRRELATQLVVVDYVQLMAEEGCRERRDEVGKAVRGLAALARAEHVAVLVLAQLNRDSEKENRRPTMRDLRETGELEQVAHAILFTHHEAQRDGSIRGEIVIAKQKHGRRGIVVPMDWDGPTATYRERSFRGEA